MTPPVILCGYIFSRDALYSAPPRAVHCAVILWSLEPDPDFRGPFSTEAVFLIATSAKTASANAKIGLGDTIFAPDPAPLSRRGSTARSMPVVGAEYSRI